MPDHDEGKGFKVSDRRAAQAEGAAVSGGEANAEARAAAPGSADRQPLPHIDFATFVMSLASSALMHLGEMAQPGTPEARPNLPLAKQTVDILGMLEEKTRGNLNDDEARLLQHLLYDLRLKFVEVRKRQ